MHFPFTKKQRQFATIIFFIELIILQPLTMPVAIALADSPSTPTVTQNPDGDPACLSQIQTFYAQPVPTIPTVNGSTPDSTTDPADSPWLQDIDFTILNNSTKLEGVGRIFDTAYIKNLVQTQGPDSMAYFKDPAGDEHLILCTSAVNTVEPDLYNPLLPVTPDALEEINLLLDPSPKLVFDNPLDYYAVVGDNCAGGFVDQPQSQWTSNPCKQFNKADDVFNRGQWTAPLVTSQLMRTIAYLIDPKGADREYIEIKSISQNNTTDNITQYIQNDAKAASLGLIAATPTSVTSNSPPAANTQSTASPSQPSKQYIDPNDVPYKPVHLSKGMVISKIDKVRVGTQITQVRVFGNNSTSYQFQSSFPIDVSWQTAQGLASDPPPDLSSLNLLGSAHSLMNEAVIQLLDNAGVGGDFNVDTSNVQINSFGDVALLLGQSLLDQTLGSPQFSLSGWDLTSTLESIGRRYLEQQLGLVTGSLSSGDDFDSIIQNMGRVSIEYSLGLPTGSLDSADGTSAEIINTVGQRYLENKVFNVSLGTLDPTSTDFCDATKEDTYPINTVGDLLERLGEGRIEQVFLLPSQSLRRNEYDTRSGEPVCNSFRQSSYKASLLFTKPGNAVSDDYSMNDFVASKLALGFTAYNSSSTDMYGFTAADYTNPLIQLKTGKMSLDKFKQLVGARVIEGSTGAFFQSGTSTPVTTQTTATRSTAALNNVPVQDPSGRGGVCSNINNSSDNRQADIEGNGPDSYNDPNCNKPQTVASDTSDLDLLANIKSMLLTTTTETKQSFTPDDSVQVAPVYGQPIHMYGINNGNTSTLDKKYYEVDYNSVESDYYNDPRLSSTVPTNTISALTSTPTSSTSEETLRNALNDVSTSNSGIQNDLSRITQLFQLQTLNGSNFFDLTPIANESGKQLDTDLTTRLNAITTQPATSDYLNQYNSSTVSGDTVGYQGWEFLLEDLQGRVDCAQKAGQYVFQSDPTNPGFACTNEATGDNTVSADQQAKYSAINDEIGTIISQLDTYSSSILGTIERGGAPDAAPTTSTGSGGTTRSASTSTTQSSPLSGQSMMSVAAGLPGQIFNTNINNQYDPNSVYYNQDPMRTLVSPQRDSNGVVTLTAPIQNYNGLIGQIGRVYAAKQFSSNPLTQKKIVTQLQVNSNTFTAAFQNLTGMGLDDSSLKAKGLDSGDFSRIFQLDLANQVFYRRGEEELLRVAWTKSGAATQITSSAEYNTLIQDLTKAGQTLGFYQSRVSTICKDTAILTSNANSLSNYLRSDPTIDKTSIANLSQQLTTLPTKGCSGNSIDQLQNISQTFEPVIGKYYDLMNVASKNDLNGQRYNQYKSDLDSSQNAIQDAMHAMQEMVAGQSLPQSRAYGTNSGFGSTTVGNNACFNGAQVLFAFTQPKKSAQQAATNPAIPNPSPNPGTNGSSAIINSLTDLGISVGSCQVDQSLGLPNNTIYNWYYLGRQAFPNQSNSDTWNSDTGQPQDGIPQWTANSWTVDSLEMAAGLADAQAKGTTTATASSAGKLSGDQVKGLIRNGTTILEAGALAKLATLIPGIGKTIASYKITASDMAAIFNGDFRPVIAKIGGANLDKLLNLPAGTGYQLIFPTCHDNNNKVTPCNDDPNVPGSDPDNIREQVLASAAFQKIGLSIPVFPASFDITAGGNMLANWGNAQVSQDLGIAPNSFSGLITDPTSDIRTENSINTLMSAFGFTPTTYQIQAQTMVGNIIKEIGSVNGLSEIDIYPLEYQIQNLLNNYLQQVTLNRATTEDPTHSYWQSNAASASSNAILIAADDATQMLGSTNSLLANIWQELSLASVSIPKSDLSVDLVTTLRQAALKGVEESKPLGVTSSATLSGQVFNADFPINFTSAISQDAPKQHDAYTGALSFFNTKINSLDVKYGLKPGTFKQFLEGKIDADDLAQSNGVRGTIQSILSNKVDQWIASSGPQWLKDLNQGFKDLTAASGMCTKPVTTKGNGFVTTTPGTPDLSQGMGIGAFLSQMVAPDPYASCNISGLSLIDGNKLLYGTSPAQIQFRDFLFNKLFSKVFSTGLEKDLGIQPGTFESMAIDPKHAPEIIISQGILKLTDQVFGGINLGDPCDNLANPDPNCLVQQLKLDLRGAFLAGFYDPNDPYNKTHPGKPIYGLEFNTNRSLNALNTLVGKEIDLQLGRIGKQYLGTQITRADIGLLMNGDGRFFSFLALQYTANAANQILAKDTRVGAQAKKSQFVINYNDVRAAAGLGKPTPQQLLTAADEGQAAYKKTVICDTENLNTADCNKLTVSDINVTYDGFFISGVLDPATEVLNVSEERLAAQDDFRQTYALNAQQVVKYKLFDIAAFEIDQNIPPNFTKRLLSGTKIQQATALTEYGYNILATNDKDFAAFMQQNGITSTDLSNYSVALVDLFAHGKNSPNGAKDLQTLLTGSVANRIDVAFTGWLTKDLDITDPNFPAGLLKGTIAWGINGFKSGDFNKTLSFGTGITQLKVPSVGLQLETYGYTVIENWGDKAIGLKVGTTKDIVQFTQILLDIGKTERQLAAATETLAFDNSIGTFYNNTLDAGSSILTTGDTNLNNAVNNLFTDPATLSGTDAPDLVQDIKDYTQVASKANAGANAAGKTVTSDTAKIDQLKGLAVTVAENILFNDVLGAQLAKVDAAIGMPPGTVAQVLSLATTGFLMWANVIKYNPATLYLSAAMLLFSLIIGVVRTVVVSTGSANGYYPFYNYGTGPAASAGQVPPNVEHHGLDPWIPDFDAQSVGQYHAGLQSAARAKVTDLIHDLVAMPTSNWAKSHGFKPLDLWIYQGFTYGDTTYDPLTDSSIAYYLNQPLPGNLPTNPLPNNPLLSSLDSTQTDVGYNGLAHCTQIAYDNTNRAICQQDSNFLSGFYPTSLYNGIFISW